MLHTAEGAILLFSTNQQIVFPYLSCGWIRCYLRWCTQRNHTTTSSSTVDAIKVSISGQRDRRPCSLSSAGKTGLQHCLAFAALGLQGGGIPAFLVSWTSVCDCLARCKGRGEVPSYLRYPGWSVRVGGSQGRGWGHLPPIHRAGKYGCSRAQASSAFTCVWLADTQLYKLME